MLITGGGQKKQTNPVVFLQKIIELKPCFGGSKNAGSDLRSFGVLGFLETKKPFLVNLS